MRDTKFQIRISQLKIVKQRRKRKEFERKRNLARNVKGYHKIHRNIPAGKRKFDMVQVPKTFSFEHNLEGLVMFTNKTFKKYKDFKYGHLFFNMSEVVEIDLPAICLLLSLLNKLTWKQISYAGNAPNDPSASDTFFRSGFLEMMNSRGFKP